MGIHQGVLEDRHLLWFLFNVDDGHHNKESVLATRKDSYQLVHFSDFLLF